MTDVMKLLGQSWLGYGLLAFAAVTTIVVVTFICRGKHGSANGALATLVAIVAGLGAYMFDAGQWQHDDEVRTANDAVRSLKVCMTLAAQNLTGDAGRTEKLVTELDAIMASGFSSREYAAWRRAVNLHSKSLERSATLLTECAAKH